MTFKPIKIMATKKPQKAAPKKAVAKPAKKTDGGKHKAQVAARSKAASAGWATRRANEAKKNLHHTEPAKGESNIEFKLMTQHPPKVLYTQPTQEKPVGTITDCLRQTKG